MSNYNRKTKRVMIEKKLSYEGGTDPFFPKETSSALIFSSFFSHIRIAVILWRTKILLNGPRTGPADEVEDGTCLVVRS